MFSEVVALTCLLTCLSGGEDSITVRQLLEHSGGWDRDKSGDIMFKHFQVSPMWLRGER